VNDLEIHMYLDFAVVCATINADEGHILAKMAIISYCLDQSVFGRATRGPPYKSRLHGEKHVCNDLTQEQWRNEALASSFSEDWHNNDKFEKTNSSVSHRSSGHRVFFLKRVSRPNRRRQAYGQSSQLCWENSLTIQKQVISFNAARR
jgi:hypothetical protein